MVDKGYENMKSTIPMVMEDTPTNHAIELIYHSGRMQDQSIKDTIKHLRAIGLDKLAGDLYHINEYTTDSIDKAIQYLRGDEYTCHD